jgi:hypothetical protein
MEVLHIACAPNCQQPGAKYSVTFVSAEAPIQADALPKRLVQAVSLYAVRETEASGQLQDAYFRQRIAAKPKIKTEHYSAMRSGQVSLKANLTRSLDRSQHLVVDAKQWTPTVGERGWVGVVKRSQSRYQDEYFIAVVNSGDQLSAELHAVARNMQARDDPQQTSTASDCTFGAFARHAKLRQAQALLSRANAKIAAALAKQLHVSVELVPDLAAQPLSVSGARPQIAKPNAEQFFGLPEQCELQLADGRRHSAVALCRDASISTTPSLLPLSMLEGIALPVSDDLPSGRFVEGKSKVWPLYGELKSSTVPLSSALERYIKASFHSESQQQLPLLMREHCAQLVSDATPRLQVVFAFVATPAPRQ